MQSESVPVEVMHRNESPIIQILIYCSCWINSVDLKAGRKLGAVLSSDIFFSKGNVC